MNISNVNPLAIHFPFEIWGINETNFKKLNFLKNSDYLSDMTNFIDYLSK